MTRAGAAEELDGSAVVVVEAEGRGGCDGGGGGSEGRRNKTERCEFRKRAARPAGGRSEGV